MATRQWQPKAKAVAQVTTVTVGGTLSSETFTISVNGVVIATHTDSTTVIAATIAGLVATWNASTHAYATGITAAAASPNLTLTGDTAEVPFTIALNTPGGSATFTQTATTAPTGPNTWDNADNWSGDTVPATNDTVVIRDTAGNIAWGLGQSAVTLTKLVIDKSYTGKIGLNSQAFATTADGATTTTAAPEYRSAYLAISATTVAIGENQSQSSPAGSQRIMLDLGSNQATVTIYGTASTSSETGRPAIRLKNVHVSSALYVRSAAGGVGVAIDQPGEVSTLALISISDESTSSRVYTSSGVTLTTWTQYGGNNVVDLAATLTTHTVRGGTCRTEGDYTITTADYSGGTVYSNHIKSAGNAITTLNISGTIDALGSTVARTWATVNAAVGGVIRADGSVLTITTLADPAAKYSATFSNPS
jgi:hypothetical protein